MSDDLIERMNGFLERGTIRKGHIFEILREIERLRAELADLKASRLAYNQECRDMAIEGAAYWKKIAEEREAELAAIKGQEPVAWPNRCDHTIVAALQYLSRFQRPEGGNDLFNAEHLEQLADELQRMANRPLYALPVADKDAERWRAGCANTDLFITAAFAESKSENGKAVIDAAIDAAMAKEKG